MLHFVRSPTEVRAPGKEKQAVEGGHPSPDELAAAVAAGRGFAHGVFDTYAYDTFTLWVADLSPYLAKLRADAVPHLIRGWPESGVGGVLVAIPGATVVYELRSDKGLSEEELAANP